MANVYLQTDDQQQALHMLQRVLSMREVFLGPQHPSIAEVLLELADLWRLRFDFALASQFAQRALEILEAAFGPRHSRVVPCVLVLERIRFFQAVFAFQPMLLMESVRLLKRALAIGETVWGLEHGRTQILRSITKFKIFRNMLSFLLFALFFLYLPYEYISDCFQ
jgi:hypothetical protein